MYICKKESLKENKIGRVQYKKIGQNSLTKIELSEDASEEFLNSGVYWFLNNGV